MIYEVLWEVAHDISESFLGGQGILEPPGRNDPRHLLGSLRSPLAAPAASLRVLPPICSLLGSPGGAF